MRVRDGLFVCALLALPVLTLAQNYPQPGPGVPGFFPTDPPVADATAVWTFNDPRGLGLEGDDSWVGDAMSLNGVASQYAWAVTPTAMAQAQSHSITMWLKPSTVSGDGTFLSVADNPTSGTPLRFFYRNGSALAAYLCGSSCGYQSVSSGFFAANTRVMITITYDGTDFNVYKDGNATPVKTWTALPETLSERDAFVYFGEGFPGEWAGEIDVPLVHSEVISTATIASLYNSYKGKTCSGLSAGELTNATNCWEMDEDGGPYADSIGSSTLTGNNTPTETTGLILTGTGNLSYMLTATGSPTATGGGDTYAADFETTSNDGAFHADSASFDSIEAMACFTDVESVANFYLLMGRDAATATNRQAEITTTGGSDLNVRFWDSSNNEYLAGANVPTLASGGRAFIAGWIDAGDCKTNMSFNDGAITAVSGAPGACPYTKRNSGSNYHVSGMTTYGAWDGVTGPCFTWSADPGDAVRTSIYNSGKGKRCEDLTAGEKVGMIHCWDLNEDPAGSTYADSIGSDDLTTLGTPARVSGLVNSGDSGMSLNLTASNSENLEGAATIDISDPGFTYSVWIYQAATPPAAERHIVSKMEDASNSQFRTRMPTGTNAPNHVAYNGTSGTFGQVTWGSEPSGWYNVTVWWRKSDRELGVSIDGGTAVTTNTGFDIPHQPTTELELGSLVGFGGGYYDGPMDYAVLWTRVLSTSEITAHVAAGPQ